MALKTNVYIDGFNLYYGCVRGTPYKWLDLAAFCARLLPKNQINRIRYFTALVTPRANDPQQRMRQESISARSERFRIFLWIWGTFSRAKFG